MDDALRLKICNEAHWIPRVSLTMQKLNQLNTEELYRRYHGNKEHADINEEFRALIDKQDKDGNFPYLYVTALGGRFVGGNLSYILDRIKKYLIPVCPTLNLENIISDLNSILKENPAVVEACNDQLAIPYIIEVCNGFLNGTVLSALNHKKFQLENTHKGNNLDI